MLCLGMRKMPRDISSFSFIEAVLFFQKPCFGLQNGEILASVLSPHPQAIRWNQPNSMRDKRHKYAIAHLHVPDDGLLAFLQ
jgi:coproporphyrinogen III oxidase